MEKQKRSRFRWWKRAGTIIIALILLYLLLLIPDTDFEVPTDRKSDPFIWNQDEMWTALERLFQDARATGCESLENYIDSGITEVDRLINTIDNSTYAPEAKVFDTLEIAMFNEAARIGACPERLPEYIELFSRMRTAVKDQSRRWDMGSAEARHTLYRLIYGGKAAIEEIMLQAPHDAIPEIIWGIDESSSSPKGTILDIKVHSGDILVSRGGAPTSALIARGNDYAGNFSHVALLHIDDHTGEISIVESHIESGVVVSTLDQYLLDQKLRIMVLRLRGDLQQIEADPLLPHKAASAAMAEARARHIPYDFEMDFTDRGKYFCSEVASTPYQELGITLWMGISRMSSTGLRMWLAGLGVRHFETQEPSDLEYDPQLRVVAEWRDPELLYKDHLDNAVLDAMLDDADSTEALEYDRYMLPMARVAKAYSVSKNLIGSIGPIPEGMSATAALCVEKFSRKHDAIKAELESRAADFELQHGYTPPYWVLVELAGRAKNKLEKSQ